MYRGTTIAIYRHAHSIMYCYICTAPQSANVDWAMRDSSVETQTTLQLIITVS